MVLEEGGEFHFLPGDARQLGAGVNGEATDAVTVDDAGGIRGRAAGSASAVGFPLVGAEVEGFLQDPAVVGGDALLELAGAVAAGIEVEVRLDLARGVDLDAGEVLQGRGAQIVQRGELAEGGPDVSALAVRGDVTGVVIDIGAGESFDGDGVKLKSRR